MIDESARRALQSELDPGETLLWAGRPAPLRYAFRRGWKSTLFGIGWMIFLAVWFTGFTGGFSEGGFDFSNPFGVIGIIVGALFLFTGIGMLLTIPREFLTALSTSYGLTPQRGLIRSGVFRQTVTTLQPYSRAVLERRGDKHGSLSIVSSEKAEPAGFFVAGWTGWDERGFYNIDSPAEVERLIRTRVKAD